MRKIFLMVEFQDTQLLQVQRHFLLRTECLQSTSRIFFHFRTVRLSNAFRQKSDAFYYELDTVFVFKFEYISLVERKQNICKRTLSTPQQSNQEEHGMETRGKNRGGEACFRGRCGNTFCVFFELS